MKPCLLRFYFLFTLALAMLSCGQIKTKGKQAVNKAKEIATEKKDAVADKIFPEFDAKTPDTKFNKKRFFEFFNFYPTTDVKNLYCHTDQMGIDASYWFAFECADSTAQKIILNLQLKLKPKQSVHITRDTQGKILDSSVVINETNLAGGLNSNPTPWWDTAFINKTTPVFKQRGNIYWNLWHDKKNNKVYILTFDT